LERNFQGGKDVFSRGGHGGARLASTQNENLPRFAQEGNQFLFGQGFADQPSGVGGSDGRLPDQEGLLAKGDYRHHVAPSIWARFTLWSPAYRPVAEVVRLRLG
jgi:hypothetical protein